MGVRARVCARVHASMCMSMTCSPENIITFTRNSTGSIMVTIDQSVFL